MVLKKQKSKQQRKQKGGMPTASSVMKTPMNTGMTNMGLSNMMLDMSTGMMKNSPPSMVSKNSETMSGGYKKKSSRKSKKNKSRNNKSHKKSKKLTKKNRKH